LSIVASTALVPGSETIGLIYIVLAGDNTAGRLLADPDGRWQFVPFDMPAYTVI